MTPIRDFVFQSRPGRVVFGCGSVRQLPREVEGLGARRTLVLCTQGQRALGERAAALIGAACAGIFDGAMMHVPLAAARHARERARELDADSLLAIGGGSTVGLAKAIALECELPIVAVPTTYAGSEMTPIHGLTVDGVKRTGTDVRVLPKVVVYDPDLSIDLPLELSVTSALNAMAHAAEGLYAREANPIHSLMAEEGMRSLAMAIPLLRAEPTHLEARTQALYGAWLCGSVLGAVGMALHHKLCHTLGGSFGLAHAQVHAIVLPHAVAYNRPATPDAMRRMARALGCDDVPLALFELARRSGVPTALRDIGMCDRTSASPRNWRWPTRTGTRGRSRCMRSARCCRTRSTAPRRAAPAPEIFQTTKKE